LEIALKKTVPNYSLFGLTTTITPIKKGNTKLLP